MPCEIFVDDMAYDTVACMMKVIDCAYAVCVTGGYLMSYWDRPFFPEWCGDAILDDSVTYDTMVRISGSFSGVGHTFKEIANMYGWTHIVLVSDDNTSSVCWYGAKPFGEIFANDENFTFTWLRFAIDPTDEQLDDIVEQIRSRTRGLQLFPLYQVYIGVHFIQK